VKKLTLFFQDRKMAGQEIKYPTSQGCNRLTVHHNFLACKNQPVINRKWICLAIFPVFFSLGLMEFDEVGGQGVEQKKISNDELKKGLQF